MWLGNHHLNISSKITLLVVYKINVLLDFITRSASITFVATDSIRIHGTIVPMVELYIIWEGLSYTSQTLRMINTCLDGNFQAIIRWPFDWFHAEIRFYHLMLVIVVFIVHIWDFSYVPGSQKHIWLDGILCN